MQQGKEIITASVTAIDPTTRAEVDLAVSTAKAYPRDVQKAMRSALTMATASQAVAEDCVYAVPRTNERGEKIDITGPSVRLAEILIGCWGNLRCQKRQGEEGEKHVTAYGTVWDLESNVLIQAESRRSIVKRNGRRYSPDMIANASNAAASIAMRNAAFTAIPKAIVDAIYDKVYEVARGADKDLVARRGRAITYWQSRGVEPDRLLARLGVERVEQIDADKLLLLRGITNRIRDGETTAEDEFPLLAQPETEAQPASEPEQPPSDPDGDLARRVRAKKRAPRKDRQEEPQQPAQAPPEAPKDPGTTPGQQTGFPEGPVPAGGPDGSVEGV